MRLWGGVGVTMVTCCDYLTRCDYGDLLYILGDREPVCMCIQESMRGDRAPRSPPGYSLETLSTTQQPTPGNGLVTIIRQTAPYYRLNLNTPLQALAIRIKLHKQCTVCNIYISPNEVIPPDSLAQLINQLTHPFLLLSDFNGKHPIWGCNSADGRGATVRQL